MEDPRASGSRRCAEPGNPDAGEQPLRGWRREPFGHRTAAVYLAQTLLGEGRTETDDLPIVRGEFQTDSQHDVDDLLVGRTTGDEITVSVVALRSPRSRPATTRRATPCSGPARTVSLNRRSHAHQMNNARLHVAPAWQCGHGTARVPPAVYARLLPAAVQRVSGCEPSTGQPTALTAPVRPYSIKRICNYPSAIGSKVCPPAYASQSQGCLSMFDRL